MQFLVYGLITGSILAIASVGFALIRQTEGFLNIAHGQFLLLGGILGFYFFDNLSFPIWLAAAAASLVVGLVGVATAKIVMQPVRSRGQLTQLFTSVGLAYVIQGALIAFFGTQVKSFSISFGKQFELLGIRITWGEICVILVAVLSILLLHLFMTRTSLGTSIRAVSSDSALAEVRGIRTERISLTVWFIASGLAGLAGVLLGLVGAIYAEMGWANILLILAATVLGGLGRIYGVVAAALLLGVLMDLSSVFIPTSFKSAVAFGVLVIVLILRPEGLFVTQRRKQAA